MTTTPDPAAPGGVPAPPPAPAPAPAPQTWFSGITDPEMTGYIQNRGLDKLPINEAFVKTATAHRLAESRLGVPADRLVQIPTQGDTAAEKAFWQKFGAPADPKDYAFEGVDDALTPGFGEMLRGSASKHNMPKDMASGVAKDVLKWITDLEASESAAQGAAIKVEQEKLEADWGPKTGDKHKANLMIADRAAAALGIKPEALSAMMAGVGGAEVARLFRDLGVKLGEARYIQDGNNPNGGVMTREQAIDRRFVLTGIDKNGQTTGKGDADWKAKLRKGDTAARQEWGDLLKMIARTG